MGAATVSDPVLITVISVLITIAGVLLGAVIYQHRTEVKDIKNSIADHADDIENLHHRQTEHLENYHTVKTST